MWSSCNKNHSACELGFMTEDDFEFIRAPEPLGSVQVSFLNLTTSCLENPTHGNEMRFFEDCFASDLRAGMAGSVPESSGHLQLKSAPSSTYEDAEHIVILMQENHSFDHIFGPLQGISGFNCPQVLRRPMAIPYFSRPAVPVRRLCRGDWTSRTQRSENFEGLRLDEG